MCLDPEEHLALTGDTEDAFEGDDGKHWATVFKAIDAAESRGVGHHHNMHP